MDTPQEIAERNRHDEQMANDPYYRDEYYDSCASDLYQKCLNDECEFRTISENHEIIDTEQLMRALRNLDDAIKDYSKMTGSISIDAVFTALSHIQDRLKNACLDEVAK